MAMIMMPLLVMLDYMLQTIILIILIGLPMAEIVPILHHNVFMLVANQCVVLIQMMH